MREIDARSFLSRFRAWLDEEPRNMEYIAEYLIERATGAHFGYFRLLFDLVDGKPNECAANELTGEHSSPLVVVDGRAHPEWAVDYRAAA
jgi:hypothetical protein